MSRSRLPGRLLLKPKMYHYYVPNGKAYMNFKIGTPMEHAERYQVPWPRITACKAGFLHAGGGIPCRPHPAVTQLVIVIIIML